MPFKQYLFILATILLVLPDSFGQVVTIKSIEIRGLKKTREEIVHRELNMEVGDTLVQTELSETIERNRNNLLNLGLFNAVEINISEWDTERNEIEFVIEVRESWYIYAVPIVEIADRNFNVWWTTYNHDLKRLNLGARLDYLNFTGRNDKLKAKWQFGYTPKQEIEYRFPYLNKRQSLGVTMGLLHSINKEVSYESRNNQEEFIMLDERNLQDKVRALVKLQFRPTHYLRQELEWTFEQIKLIPESSYITRITFATAIQNIVLLR